MNEENRYNATILLDTSTVKVLDKIGRCIRTKECSKLSRVRLLRDILKYAINHPDIFNILYGEDISVNELFDPLDEKTPKFKHYDHLKDGLICDYTYKIAMQPKVRDKLENAAKNIKIDRYLQSMDTSILLGDIVKYTIDHPKILLNIYGKDVKNIDTIFDSKGGKE